MLSDFNKWGDKMLEALKKRVYAANLELVKRGLVIYTWGNVSGYDKETGYVVIKPSGVDYETMKASDMVVVNLEGEVVEGSLKPSSDTLTHLEIYKHFKGVCAVVHTHSKWATIFAQSQRAIPALGTTHADYFDGEIPLTRVMREQEVTTDYERETGKVIVETFAKSDKDPLTCPAILVNEHGPFVWGRDPEEAVHHAVVLEAVAEMAFHTLQLRASQEPMNTHIQNKHYTRKHGKNKYYGQNN